MNLFRVDNFINMFGPKSPAYSIGKAQRESSSPKHSPGPADYNISLDKSKGLSFSKSSRTQSSQFANPGPGEYNIASKIGTGPKSIIIPRRLRQNTDIIPGPGEYSPKTLEKSPSFTFKKQTISTQISINPGPGAYSPISPLNKAPVATFGKSKRVESNSNASPGPGRYHVEASPKSCEHTFTKARRKMSGLRTPVPGPGEYSPYSNEHHGTSAIIIPRRPATAGKHKADTPGPGAYSGVKNSWDAPKWTIPKSLKDSCSIMPSDILSIEKKLTQGNYTDSTEIMERRGSSVKNKGKNYLSEKRIFTTAEASEGKGTKISVESLRRQFMKGERTPGPGHYDISRSFERRGLTFTKSSRIRIAKIYGPGPGQYDIPHTIGTAL